MANNCFPDPKLYPQQISVILNKGKNVHIPYFSWPLVRKMTAATPLADESTWNFATMCPKGVKKKSEILETLGERVLEFWLPVWWCGPKSLPPPTLPPIGYRVNAIWLYGNNSILRAAIFWYLRAYLTNITNVIQLSEVELCLCQIAASITFNLYYRYIIWPKQILIEFQEGHVLAL